MATMQKDPEAVLPFAVDWSAWAANEGEAVTSSEWALVGGVDDEDVPIPGWLVIEATPPPTLVANVATVWLSEGTAGVTYQVTNTVETAAGRVDERTIRIMVRER